MEPSSRLTGIISEKDENSIITSCNEVFLEYAGVSSFDKILGFSDYDFPWQEYADIYRKHELDALSGNNYSTLYPLKDYSGENHLFLHTKMQKISSDGKMGIKCHAIEIMNPQMTQLIINLSEHIPEKQFCFSIGKQFKTNLSPRQREILFFILRGKPTKIIARYLNISPRTIEYYTAIIKNKFQCKTKLELMEKAVYEGHMEDIPTFFLQKPDLRL